MTPELVQQALTNNDTGVRVIVDEAQRAGHVVALLH